MKLLFSSSKVLRVDGLERVEEGAISLAEESWMEDDEEDSFGEFAWPREMLGLAKSKEEEDIVSKMLIRATI